MSLDYDSVDVILILRALLVTRSCFDSDRNNLEISIFDNVSSSASSRHERQRVDARGLANATAKTSDAFYATANPSKSQNRFVVIPFQGYFKLF